MKINNRFKHLAYKVFAPGTLMREKYEGFKDLLENDKRAHELMAELEEIYYSQTPVDLSFIEDTYRSFAEKVAAVIEALARIEPSLRGELREHFRRFDSYVRFMLTSPLATSLPPYVLKFNQIDSYNQDLVGGKAMHLAEVRQQLELPVPAGFAITANAFNLFIEQNNLRSEIDHLLANVDAASSASLNQAADQLTELIEKGRMPTEVEAAVQEAVSTTWPNADGTLQLAVRSSAVSEDSHNSFAGQYDTLLNISPADLLGAFRKVLASKYSPRAIFYRINCGLSDSETPMAVLILEMIDSRSSGVMYSHDIQNPASDSMAIHAIWGLGEMLVDGRTSPDVVRLDRGDPPMVTDRSKGDQERQLVSGDLMQPASIGLTRDQQDRLAIEDAAAVTLGQWALKLVDFYGQDQDVEWCIDQDNQLYLLQSRALQSSEVAISDEGECDFSAVDAKQLITGAETASSGVGGGPVYRIGGENELDAMPAGAVLLARHASPRYVSVLNRVAAVITETGSVAGHFASVAREFGVPVLVHAKGAFERLAHGVEVSVDASGGIVYQGLVTPILENPCVRTNRIIDSPFMRRLSSVMSFISPLRLVDPTADKFKPLGSRSLHDILRFCHETAVRKMFHLGDRRIRKMSGSKKLETDIPMQFLVLDVGGGLEQRAVNQKTIGFEDIVCPALKAVFEGLSHPEIQWGDFSHFDWAEHDRIVMNGGIISPEAAMFASHVVVSEDYANMNLRFGYHFVIIDTICGEQAENNHILFRFSGGGADFEKRMLRADFLSTILQRLELDVHRKSDLVDAELKEVDQDRILEKLNMIGRLLGASRLMDMYLKDESMVAGYADEFMSGRYHFSTTEL